MPLSLLQWLLCFTCLAVSASAEPSATQPSDEHSYPYRIIRETRDDPPQRIFIAKIDLTSPQVQVRVVPGGDDPDGQGPWQTTLLPTSEIARRENFDLAVNASFFSVREETDEDGKKLGYRRGVWASAVGRTVTDGQVWSSGRMDWPVFWIDKSGKAHITMPAEVRSPAQVVAGNAWIIRDGQDAVPTEGMMTVRHPRTAVGIDREGKTLVIFTVDGRRPLSAVGMTGAEMRDELLKHGVHHAINLDGGGSTTLVQRNRNDGAFDIVNTPSDGRERPVANVLGVSVGRASEQR